MYKEDFEIAFKYIGYLIYLVASVGCYWLFMSGEFNPFFSISLLICSLVGIIVCSVMLLKNKERLREISEVIIPKKIRRRLKRLHNRFFKEGFV